MTKCKCGNKLSYTVSPFMTTEKRVCPKCGELHYVDDRPIDWKKVNMEKGNELPYKV